jgi:leader peptidase (prepilin peptidase)/N-methyltransferase
MAMKAVGVMQVSPTRTDATMERLVRAWDHATCLLRRATVLAATTSLVVGATAPAPLGVRVGVAACGVFLACAAMVDVHERRLPNRLIAAACITTLLSVSVGRTLTGVVGAVLGLVLGAGLLLIVRFTRGVGMGDVKMAATVGASIGSVAVAAVPVGLAVAAAAAAATGFVRRRHSLPFGPALWFGWAVALSATSMGWWT